MHTSLVIKRSETSIERLLAPHGEEIVSEVTSLDVEGHEAPPRTPFDVVFVEVEVEDVARAASWIKKASALAPRPTIVAIAVDELKAKDGFRLQRAGADALVALDPPT